MPLLTINDLLKGDPTENDTLTAKLQTISEQYEQLLGLETEREGGRPPGIHASEISGCERRVVYSLLKTERRENKNVHELASRKWKRKFRMGHILHDMFQSDFERLAQATGFRITFQREVAIRPGPDQPIAAQWDIWSHTDGIFTIRESWHGPAIARAVLEIKSMADDEYDKLKEPKPEHIEQAHVYMACLDIPFTWFLYVNKNNQNFTPSTDPKFFIPFNPELWHQLEERFERMHSHAFTETLPPRTEGIGCEFCAFSWTCNPTYLAKGRGHQHNNKWKK